MIRISREKILFNLMVVVICCVGAIAFGRVESHAADDWKYSETYPEDAYDVQETTLYKYHDFSEDEYTVEYGAWRETKPEGEFESKSVYRGFVYTCPCRSWFWCNSGGEDISINGCHGATAERLRVYCENDIAQFEDVDDADHPSYWCAKLPKVTSFDEPGEFGEIYLMIMDGKAVNEFVSGSSKGVAYIYTVKLDNTSSARESKKYTIYRSVTRTYPSEDEVIWSDLVVDRPDEIEGRKIIEVSGYMYKELQNQTINAASSMIAYYGGNAINLGKNALTERTYKSSNTKVATVSSDGIVRARGFGKATITITAAEGNGYKGAVKKIQITTKLKKPSLKASLSGRTSVKLSWTKSNGCAGYKIYRAKGASGKFKLVATKSSKVSGTTNMGLARKTTYRYKVRSYKKVNGKYIYSSYSPVIKVRTK